MTRSEGTSPAHVLLAPGQLSPELRRVLLQRLDLQVLGGCLLRQLSELRIPAGSQRRRLFPEPGQEGSWEWVRFLCEVSHPAQTLTLAHAHAHALTHTLTCTCTHSHMHMHTHSHLHALARAHTRTCTHSHTHSHSRSNLHTHSHTRAGLREMLQIMPPPHLHPRQGDLLAERSRRTPHPPAPQGPAEPLRGAGPVPGSRAVLAPAPASHSTPRGHSARIFKLNSKMRVYTDLKFPSKITENWVNSTRKPSEAGRGEAPQTWEAPRHRPGTHSVSTTRPPTVPLSGSRATHTGASGSH